jgi:LysM repeat protein
MADLHGRVEPRWTARRRVFAGLLVLTLAYAGLCGASPALGALVTTDADTYVVGWGDTLNSIAQRYGTSVSAIVQANGVSDPDLIYVGQRLSIPRTGSVSTDDSGIYVVQSGDTLSSIAARHQTTVDRLVQMNGLSNPNFILVGQRLAVPEATGGDNSTSPQGSNTLYTVQAGDTLIGIAVRFGVSMWDIVVANNIANPSLIYVGQSLVIRGAESATGSTPTPTPTAKAAATQQANTPTPKPATATPTQSNPTPATSNAFHYVQGSMQRAPNCGTVYFKGKVIGVGGEPVDGKTVRLRFAGNVVYRVSGEGQDPGEWSFAPLAAENYHSPFTFLIDVVESQANPATQSDTVEIGFSDCDTAGQFTNILFQYGSGRVENTTSNPTATPAATPTATYVPQNNLSPVEWDSRLDQLPCVRLVTVAERGQQLKSGDRYWRLVKARWLSEEESRKDIQIYVDLLDEAGERVYGVSVAFENGGHQSVVSEYQSCCYPWDYPVKYPMFNTVCSYNVYVEGLPSDMVAGMGLGTPEHPDWTIHTGFVLTFQRTVYR